VRRDEHKYSRTSDKRGWGRLSLGRLVKGLVLESIVRIAS